MGRGWEHIKRIIKIEGVEDRFKEVGFFDPEFLAQST
jgi:hypothetical protein